MDSMLHLLNKSSARGLSQSGTITPRFVIVGLGNPGRYVGTRHNIGYEVVDALSAQWKIPVRTRRHQSRVGAGEIQNQSVLLVKPETYMNESGKALQSIRDTLAVPVSHLLVICDDIHLPLGSIRLRRNGSHGGHNGLRSIINCIGSNEFPRLRIGLGGMEIAPEHWMDFVLARFSAEERLTIEEAISGSAEAVVCYMCEGIEAAMSRFN